MTHTVNYHLTTNLPHIRSSPPAVMAMSQQFPPPVNRYTGSFTEDTEGYGIRMNAFGHEDADVAFDPRLTRCWERWCSRDQRGSRLQ